MKRKDSRIQVSRLSKWDSFANIIVRIGANHGMKAKDAFARFEKDMKNYDVVLGLQTDVEALSQEKASIQSQIAWSNKDFEKKENRAKKDLEELNQQVVTKKAEIEAYSKLRLAGVRDETLLRLSRIIENSKLSAQVMESELTTTSSLQQSQEIMKKEIKELEENKKSLVSFNQELDRTKKLLQFQITTITESAIRNMEKTETQGIANIDKLVKDAETRLTKLADQYSRVTNGSLADVKQNLMEIQENTTNILNVAVMAVETSTSQGLESSKKFTNDLQKLLQDVKPQIENVGIALEVGEKIGRYMAGSSYTRND